MAKPFSFDGLIIFCNFCWVRTPNSLGTTASRFSIYPCLELDLERIQFEEMVFNLEKVKVDLLVDPKQKGLFFRSAESVANSNFFDGTFDPTFPNHKGIGTLWLETQCIRRSTNIFITFSQDT